MDLLGIVFSIIMIAHSVFGFIVVKKYCKRWEKSKHVIENDEKLQKEFGKELKKIVIMVTVSIILLVFSTVINLILIFTDA